MAETKDVAASHADVVKEFQTLLNRYRDGGYSRELPPANMKPKVDSSALPPLAGEKVLSLPLNETPGAPWSAFAGKWSGRDGALWGASPAGKGAVAAGLRGPLALGDGTLQYEVNLATADRHSLRIHTAGNKHSFRIVVGRGRVEITKNPDMGQPQTETVQLAEAKVKMRPTEWHTLRVTFSGDEVSVQIAGATVKVKHPVLAENKETMNLLAFEGEMGFRNLVVVK